MYCQYVYEKVAGSDDLASASFVQPAPFRRVPMRIRTKLVMTFLLIPLLGGIAGYFTLGNITQVGKSFDVLHFEAVPIVTALKDAKAAALAVAAATHNIAAEREETAVAVQTDLIDRGKVEFRDALNRYVDLTSAISPEQNNADEITEKWQAFESASDRVLVVLTAGSQEKELSRVLEDFTQSERALTVIIDNSINIADGLVKEEEGRFASSLDNARYLTVVIIAVASSSSLAIVVLVLRSISKPLTALRHVTRELTKGNFDAQVDRHRDDEIGELADDFDDMKQELKEKDRLKQEFINIAAHELRTPVLPIILTAEELSDEMNPDSQEKIARILRNARRLNKLANDILDVSRIESNTFKINKSKTSILDLVRDIVSDARVGIKHDHNTQVVFQSMLSEERQEVLADREKIQQVLTNLISNSMDFTDNGTITVSIGDDPDNEESIQVKVTDTGKGIDPSIAKNLFQKFVTGQNKAKGTGLGLFICKAIIEAHDGKISAQNNEKGGATFSFTLPISDRMRNKYAGKTLVGTNGLVKASHG